MRAARMLMAVDLHAAGEPGRVILGGIADVPGDSMFEKRQYFEEHLDGIRKLMLREPRGYPALCCNVVLPPTDRRAAAGFVIMEQTEYPPMSGSNLICTATALLETGYIAPIEPTTDFMLETPAGLVGVSARVEGGKTKSITFENVPAFAVHLDAVVEVPKLGTVTVDVAYGGMFYAIVQAEQLGFRISPDEGRDLVRVGEMIKAAAREQLPVTHPDNPAISGVSIMQFSGPSAHAGIGRRNTVVVSSGQFDWDRLATWTGVLDRSPCGTGTCAQMAVLHAKGQLGLNEDFVHEGILGTTFTGRLIRSTTVGPYAAVVPTITGSAYVYAISNYVLDPTDPFPEGFTVGDIWSVTEKAQ
ncbi:MAG: proline racemase [Chloroflexota bacterium]|nr:proline racemase [Chloroflexota bacterium]